MKSLCPILIAVSSFFSMALPGFAQSFQPAHVIGNYEYRPTANDWHVGSISDAGNGKLRWTNKAKVSWLLTPNSGSDTLATGDDNPYQKQGIKNYYLQRNSNGVVTGFKFNNLLFHKKNAPSEFIGDYEHRPTANDWHVGSISDAGNGKLRWTNQAKVSWLLTPSSGSDTLVTGNDNPYQSRGIKNYYAQRSSSGIVTGFKFNNLLFHKKNATKSLRLDQITLLCTHNSFATQQDKWIYAMQPRNIETQLRDGVRAFMLDTAYHSRSTKKAVQLFDYVPSGVHLQHGMVDGAPSAGLTYALPRQQLWQTLQVFDRFLEKNPGEILMVTLQDRTSAEQLQRALDRSRMVSIFEDKGFSYNGPLKRKSSEEIAVTGNIDIPDLDKWRNRKWRNDVDSIRIPSGVTVTAWEDRNYRKKQYGPFVGPALIKEVQGRNDWDSMRIRITSPDRKIGIDRFLYDPSDENQWPVKTKGWPTLEWMKRKNRRLIIFSNKTGRPVPHYWDFVAENSYGSSDPKVVPREGEAPLDQRYVAGSNNQFRKLFVMNNFAAASDPMTAKPLNRKDAILSRVQAHAIPAAGRAPNWIAVDWYSEANHGARAAVQELNRRANRN